MKADGREKRQLTDSHWEDAMPCFVPRAQAGMTSEHGAGSLGGLTGPDVMIT
jgi:hypothetical protein